MIETEWGYAFRAYQQMWVGETLPAGKRNNRGRRVERHRSKYSLSNGENW
jgi:hypothetical protein